MGGSLMPEWIRALEEYRYSVILHDYPNADQYQDFFNFPIPIGNRADTVAFETHFRDLAATNIEVWIEVIYWKMYSQKNRRNKITNQVVYHLQANEITPQALLSACENYIDDDTQLNLYVIRQLLGFATDVIAIAATFPAFLRPDLFPMVDTRIAKWVGQNMLTHNNANHNAPQLVRPHYYLDRRTTVLTLKDFEFVHSWYRWCKYKANQLSELTPIEWRSRDVEMAVFKAWGNRHEQHPIIELEIIP
jgi:hypothetical protein